MAPGVFGSRLLFVLFAIGFKTSTAEDVVQPKVFSISPHEGSYMGSTRLHIHGQGFSSAGNFNSAEGQSKLGNKAYLLSDFETIPCDVENDASHETMIVCYTRAMKRDHHYYIQVEVDGYLVPLASNCNRNYRHWHCRFITRWYKTPYIDDCYVQQEEGDTPAYPTQISYPPGGLITCTGRIFTQIYGSNNQTNENGKTVSFRRIYVGGQSCDLFKEPDVFYNLKLLSGDNGIFTCKTKGTFVGAQNVSAILTDEFGRSELAKTLYKTDSKDKVYNFQTYAEITRVIPQVGSIEGGTRVLIEGKNFDDTNAPIKVMVGGNICDVVPGTLKDDSVECIARKSAADRDYYTGSRGVVMELWNETTVDNEATMELLTNASNYEGAVIMDASGMQWNNDKDYFVAKYTGVFVAPKTDRYKFKIAADDHSSLYMNCEGSKENLTKVAYSTHATTSFIHGYQTSDWMELEEGQECYFVSVFREYGGAAHMNVAALRATTTLTATQSTDAVNEIQVLDFHTVRKNEEQNINFTSWSSQQGVVEVQEITVTHSCIDSDSSSCDYVGYRLVYDKIKTLFIKADASASAVRNALNDIFALKDENIAVSVASSTGSRKYTVEFRQKRGDYATLTYQKFPSTVQGLTIAISEETKGVSERKTFKLRLAGRLTEPIAENSDENSLDEALEATRDAYCPSFLLPDFRSSAVVTTQDYETTKHGSQWGYRKQDVEPFCGRTSLKDVTYIFHYGRTADVSTKKHTAFDAVQNRWMCFAHLGLMRSLIYLHGRFNGDGVNKAGGFWFPWSLQQHETEWRYSCVDLLAIITSDPSFTLVTEVTINVIKFERPDRDHHYYIDAFTIGANKVTDDIDGVLGVRTPAALADGKPLSKVTVKKAVGDRSFDIELDTIDCGHMIPLITMAFTTTSSASSDALTQRESSWPAETSFKTTRLVNGVAPMSGTFDLTVKFTNGNEYNVTDIPVSLPVEQFAERLETEVKEFGQARVWWGGGCHARDYGIEWLTNGGDKPQMELRMHNVGGESDIIGTAKTHQDGGILHNPITGDMLRNVYDKPQVEVFVNGYASKCIGNCEFLTSEAMTPIVSSISPTTGSLFASTDITITGTNLDKLLSHTTTVSIGQAKCNVTSNTANQIVCALGVGALGTYDVMVNVGGKGYAKKMNVNVSLEFTISGGVTQIAPTTGFSTGGTEVKITGYGFTKNTTFKFDNKNCDVKSVTPTEVTCITSKASVAVTNVKVTVEDGSNVLGTVDYTYIDPTAIVTNISPATSTVIGGGNLTITGNDLGSNKEMVKVMIGEYNCKIITWSTTEIICTLPEANPGQYKLNLVIVGSGSADTSTNSIPPINYNLEVDKVSPIFASMNGGTKIEISGNGFTDKMTTEVKFGDSVCEITSITSTSIECELGRATKVHKVTNNGIHESMGKGFAWDPVGLKIHVGDTVMWQWEFKGIPGGWDYGAMIFTTETSDSDEYDGVGFRSGSTKTAKGTYSYTFNEAGSYFVSTGKIDEPNWGTIIMRGSIVVEDAKSSTNGLSLKVAGHEAKYVKSRKKRSVSTCSGAVSQVSGCVSTPLPVPTTPFYVATGTCYTPTITSISPNNGTTAQTITIKGTGFGTENCANKVIIADGYSDEYECDVISSTSSTIKCKPSPVETPSINVAYHVKVNVDNIGDTSTVIKADSERRFTLLPSVSSLTPKTGSLVGGALVNITGSGFSTQSSMMSVTIGGYSCIIQSSSYFLIQCTSPSSAAEGKQDVVVTINGQVAECTGTCMFEYKESLTPTITAFAPPSVSTENAEIVFEGTGFSSDEEKVKITIGDKTCDVTSSTSTKIKCNISELPAGNHQFHISIDDRGKARLDGVAGHITSPPVLTSMHPVNGSKAGGTKITFMGNGFNSEDLKVKLGNTKCEIDRSTMTNFKFYCITPAKTSGSNTKSVVVTSNGNTYASKEFKYEDELTPELTSISPSTGESGDVVTINGTLLQPNVTKIYIGNTMCTDIDGDQESVTCTVGDHLGGNYPVTAKTGEMGYALSTLTFNYTFSITSVSPASGSFAGGDMLTITGKGFSNLTAITVCNSSCEHGAGFAGTSADSSTITCKLATSSSTTADSNMLCDITATADGRSVTGENLYTFDVDKTPKITKVSPARGGTQGGTNVTITGTLFDSDDTKVSVSIGGIACTVTSSSATEIKCTTNARGKSLKALVEVEISGKGKALNNDTEFYYVDVWSSKWTWGGQDPPVAGDFVVVPTGQTLVIDVDTPVLKMILIQGGIIMFDEKDIHLQTENILITDGGVLQIGTEEEPFQHKAIITLHGHLRSPELPIYGTKTIGVRNGTLDIHGRHVPTTWTHLKETAAAGTKILKLQKAITWNVGDEIVIASTGHRHSQKENEKMTIAVISGDKMTLTLTENLKYSHISATEAFEGVTVETHAEVGLLTRNVVVQGSTHMEWAKDVIPACEEGFNTGEFATQTCFQGRFGEEEGSDQFGAQIMIHHRAPDLDIARARLEHVELRHMGQAFRLGRYPIHFHMLGDVGFKNYVKGCSIHESFNRAVTIHKTHHLLVERNVLYNIMGGAVFIEDGIEHGNVISENLVVFCKQSTSLQNDDITPAAFWVTNPNNTLQHNAAAGGTHFGFWYRIHQHPDGPSFDANICQQLHPVQKFENNTVHSQGWFGIWVFQRYTPRGDGSCGSSLPVPAEFHSLTAWNCEKGAELVNVGAIKFFNFVMYHNSFAGIETKLVVDDEVKWGQVGTYDSFVIARGNGLTEGGTTKIGLILPFTEGMEVKNTKFINFDESGSNALGVTSIDGTCSVLCGGWEARFANISFNNSPNKAAFRWEHEVILRDLDGSLSGTNKHSIITPKNPTISASECTKIEAFSKGAFEGVICDGVKKFHRVSWNKVVPTSLEAKMVTLTTESGSTWIPFAKKRLTHKFGWMGTVEDGQTYDWTFEEAGHLVNISYQAGFYNFEESDCVIIAHNLTQKPDKFIIAGDSEEYAQEKMVTCADNFHGDYFFDANDKKLFYIVSGKDRFSRKKRFTSKAATVGAVNREVHFRVYRCFYDKCIPPPDPNDIPPARSRPDTVQIWHESDYWKTNEEGEFVGTIEGDGATNPPPDNKDIRIEKGTWMVVKQDFPKINKLWIEGVLELEWEDSSLSFTLSASHIIIMGGRLIVGWEDSLFKGMANIVLRGDHSTTDLLLNGGVNLGAKAIGVLGGLDLHGKNIDLTTSHLASKLSSGQNTITIVDSPSDWSVGEEIVIATTSADPWETETFKISAINDKTLTLNASARFDHIAETFSYNDHSGAVKTYDIRAEVSRLTRNIKVIGEDYANLYDQSFGARILVAGVGSTRGFARISNVEFYHTGQEGYIDNYDPRYSLAFLNTGTVDTVKPSFVKRNSFHHGFNTAIGVFGATGLEVKENTIHHTVGPGIRVEGESIKVLDNTVMLVRTRSVYQDRQEEDLLLWKAGIEVNLAKSPVLSGNVVAGSERGGFRIDGHNCGFEFIDQAVEWGTNTARACLHGIWMNKDGFSCTSISKFNIHSSYDYGVYYQGSGSLQLSQMLVTDSTFGISAIVYSPPSISHAYSDKYVTMEDSTIVAVSMPDYCPSLPSSTDYLKNSGLSRGIKRTNAGTLARVGILWPSFISGQNAAPSKPFVGSMSYQAIGGRSSLKNVNFVNFGDETCSKLHTGIMTNLKIEDFLHPITVEGLNFVNSPENTRLFFHRPSLGKINPSDCVDMECDGMKKVLIKDKDGSMTGSPGTIIPQAEFEWDGDRRRGLGDYRIPKTFLTKLDGSRIPVDDIVPYKGILRANTSNAMCVPQDIWQAHKCTGYKHGILVIESLDQDTETRRISPVGLAAEEYIDLNNGPQDHGWCAGYTCQERLSTFMTIVALEKSYEMHFTGTAPQQLRLRLLNESDMTKMVLKIFYTRPQRLDVYMDRKYQKPTNSKTNDNGDNILIPPSADRPNEFHPNVTSDVGVNYYDRTAKIIHVTLSGKTPVEIHEANVVVITFDLPAVSPDEFFDNGKLVSNLALFLNIPASKIRLVNAVREGSTKRRKRAVGNYKATVEIGDQPSDTIEEDTATNVTTTAAPGATTPATSSLNDLARAASTITNALQNNTLSAALGTEVDSLSVADPRVPPTRNPNITNTTDTTDAQVEYFVPGGLKIVQQPTGGNAEAPLLPTLQVTGVDTSGNAIVLGHKGDQWQATVTINNDPTTKLSGTTIAKFVNGIATFENLAVSREGSFVLQVTVTYPTGQTALTTVTDSFTVSKATVSSTTINPSLTTTVKVNTVPPSASNMAVIIACSVVGGLVLIAIIIVIVLKGPCSKKRGSHKVSHYDIDLDQMDKGKYTEQMSPPPKQNTDAKEPSTATEVTVQTEAEESQHPHSASEDAKHSPSPKKNSNPYDDVK